MRYFYKKILFLIFTVLAMTLSLKLIGVGSYVENSLKVGMTIIPAGVVTNKSDVEIRTGISGISEDMEFTLEITVDSQVVEKRTIRSKDNEYLLEKHWWDTADKEGTYVIGSRVYMDEVLVREENRVITVVDYDYPSLAIGTVAWIEPGAYLPGVYSMQRTPDEAYIRNQIDEMKQLGINTIIFTYAEYVLINAAPFYNSGIDEFNIFKSYPGYDMLAVFLSQAEENGQHVFVGTGRGFNLWPPVSEGTYANEHKGYDYAVDLCVRVINDIYDKYGHYRSLYGFYMSHEPSYLKTSPPNDDLTFYDEVIGKVRSRGPDKVFIVSPTGTPVIDVDSIKNSNLDIFAFQDAVGPGYVPYQYTYDPERRISMLEDVFSNYADILKKTEKHLWSNFETWEMKGPHYADPYPASFDRVIRQLEIEKQYVSVMSMYAYPGYLEHPDSKVVLGGQKAVDLYTEYSAYAKDHLNELGIKYPGFSDDKMILEIKTDADPLAMLPKTVELSLDNNKIISANVQWDEDIKEDNTVAGIVLVPGIKGEVKITAFICPEDEGIKGNGNQVEEENDDMAYAIIAAGLLLIFCSLYILFKRKKVC